MATSITNQTTRLSLNEYNQLDAMFDNKQKLEEEIVYAKKLEAFVHKKILPAIASKIDEEVIIRRIDKIAHQDFHGLRERIFTCLAAVDHIIECHNNHTDHIDLLLDLITRENQTFTDVLYNGTMGGKHVIINHPRLDVDNDRIAAFACESHAIATTYSWGREP